MVAVVLGDSARRHVSLSFSAVSEPTHHPPTRIGVRIMVPFSGQQRLFQAKPNGPSRARVPL